MREDNWLVDLTDALRRAATREAVLDVIERLEDQYDAFSGPGQELLDDLLAEARRRLDSI